MKVLHICPGYFRNQFYDKLFLALQSLNVITEVFAYSIKNVPYKNLDRPYNIKVLDKKFSLFERLAYFGKQYTIYKNVCKEYSLNEFNIVHAHTLFSSGFAAYLIYKRFGLPYIVAVRDTDLNVFLKKNVPFTKFGACCNL